MVEITRSDAIGFSPDGIYKFPDKDGVYVIAEVSADGTH